MRASSIRTKILFSYLGIILFIGLSLSIFGYYVVGKYILDKVQEEVQSDLTTVWSSYEEQLTIMKTAFEFVSPEMSLQKIKQKIDLDYVFRITADAVPLCRSNVAVHAFERKRPAGGTRIIEEHELRVVAPQRANELMIDIKPTPKAKFSVEEKLSSVMAIEYARPIFEADGTVVSVLYGGKIINKNFDFIDAISDTVFEHELYQDKPVGTVTVFQGDVRIATNVLDQENQRAIGTRVSEEVYERVIENGKKWLDKAFVVTDWYITAYEPIRNISGDIIGILYVGILEKPYIDMGRKLFLVFFLIIAGASVMAMGFAVMHARKLGKPITEILQVTRKIAHGELDSKVVSETDVRELNELLNSFNEMGEKLAEREKSLAESNDKLAALNKSYLDMIGFVSHELKGILASTILNVHSVRGGFLGMTNFKQQKALDSVARNMDYLSETVKNFLSLSRIEKGEFSIEPVELNLKETVVNEAVDTFHKQAIEKNLTVLNTIPADIQIIADPDLLKIVVNNILSNAIKYGTKGSTITMAAINGDGVVTVSIYNEGVPLTQEDVEKLFKKFSRIKNDRMKREKGTGLGLFITKEIVENHNGRIWVKPELNGNTFLFTIPKEVKK